MASLRAARCAITPGLRQSIGFSSARPLTASLRPHLVSRTARSPQRAIGARDFSLGGLVNSSVEATSQVVVSLHSMNATGNWTGTIVFSALLISLCRAPLQYYARRVVERQGEIAPFMAAWSREIRGTRLSRAMQLAKVRKRMLKELGAQNWKTWAPALGLPVWYLMSESLRRLCGANSGILSLLTGNYKNQEASAGVASTSVSEQASTAASSSADAVSSNLDSLSYVAEGMANGGVLWFTDLTVADPTILLPAMLMGTLGWLTMPKGEMRKYVFNLSTAEQNVPPGLRWRIRLQRGLLLTAILIPALCVNLPAGIFVYWISSMIFSQISVKIMDKVRGKHDPWKPSPHYERLHLRGV
ncbi:hypothetical protein HER10_EVM0011191 [Colletotrichum scovillei]|uniref:Mitochondrial export translocase oxa2 n=1 Tax=Colletotrichum scovillei TaxID=1209932 RepID=A0A9P7RDS3_9PEZI|nr:uncharacterized protein HER10_EVM0011191 [Colletotrichum scovillei]KAF4777064.1 hypothetical protein HER10_EVM0011191 [Colletotrichum scovillei]KAG7054166.1 mitochondrial export translocase oxa2 [Colletotrichum scovillei]KAG7072463.1 mitochondrial export translocase oxa2 [Colletotrichum scovillei]KAG7080831.1 mitochondrial export translocase oxa2 [Colletotrichum scovillei]